MLKRKEGARKGMTRGGQHDVSWRNAHQDNDKPTMVLLVLVLVLVVVVLVLVLAAAAPKDGNAGEDAVQQKNIHQR